MVQSEALRFFWSAFGLGLSPWAPGTCGTLAGVALAYLLPGHVAIAGAALAVFLLGVPLARLAEKAEGRADPPSFVLDEVAGYLIAVFGLPLRSWPMLLGAFAAFRLFDIWKPPPIRRLEKLPGGWGVMADDLVAGLYAHAAMRTVLLFL